MNPVKILALGAMRFPSMDGADLHSYSGIKKFFAKCGGNTGNCVIGEYGRMTLAGEITDMRHLGGKIPAEEVNERFDHIVIFAANWCALDWNADFESSLAWYKGIKIPVSVIGLGQQSQTGATDTHEKRAEFARALPDGAKRLFRLWSEKNTHVSCRGPQTCEILGELGITNAEPTGCSTWFVNGASQPDITPPPITKTVWNASLFMLAHWDHFGCIQS